MELTKSFIKKCNKQPTPALYFSLKQIIKRYKEIVQSIHGIEVFYAMKANDNPTILKTLIKQGSSFEVSSLAEMEALLKLGVLPKQIFCLNPIKNPVFLKRMQETGVEIMAFDSYDEIDKIAKFAPNSKVVLRLAVDNKDSDWPLTKKFGIDVTEALPLLQYAKKAGLMPYGLTFHVGSQCRNSSNWANALYVCNDVWRLANENGIHMSLISLGGGIPVKHLKKIPSVKDIGQAINKALAGKFKTFGNNHLRVTIEPGRGLVGDAAIMVTSVVGKAKRGQEDWIYIDAGVFNGLMETVANFKYELKTGLNNKKRSIVTVAGPSCDSVDIPFQDALLPKLKLGDKVYVLNTGAYTTVYAANFNGFPIPSVYFVD